MYRGSMTAARRVKLFKTGRSHAVRIPAEFRLSAQREVLMSREGDLLVLKPIERRTAPGASSCLERSTATSLRASSRPFSGDASSEVQARHRHVHRSVEGPFAVTLICARFDAQVVAVRGLPHAAQWRACGVRSGFAQAPQGGPYSDSRWCKIAFAEQFAKPVSRSYSGAHGRKPRLERCRCSLVLAVVILRGTHGHAEEPLDLHEFALVEHRHVLPASPAPERLHRIEYRRRLAGHVPKPRDQKRERAAATSQAPVRPA
jgi:virulence-associated protein VagC